jgi:hypothetical protein
MYFEYRKGTQDNRNTRFNTAKLNTTKLNTIKWNLTL